MEGHSEAAEAHLRWARDRPREFDLVSARAQWLAWQGRMREARDAYRQVMEFDRAAEPPGNRRRVSGPSGLDRGAVRQQGRTRSPPHGSRCLARTIESSSPDAVPRYRAAADAGARRRSGRADTVLREMSRRYPQSTLTNAVMRPVVAASSAIARGQYADAIARLKVASDYELGTVATLVPVYLRGVAYLGLKRRRERR